MKTEKSSSFNGLYMATAVAYLLRLKRGVKFKLEKVSLILLTLFLGMGHALAESGDDFSDGSPLPLEDSRLMREEMGDDFTSSWVKKALEKAGNEKGNPQKTWERYLEIQEKAPEELLEQEAGHWETARLVVWRKMKKMLEESNGSFIKNSLDIAASEHELKRLYEEVTDDFELTPYEAFKFSWVAAPHLPTRMGGYFYEKIGDALLEQGNLLRAYATYQNILNYSTHRVVRRDFTERVTEKLKALRDRYGDILNKVEKVGALEGISLSDGTRYRVVVEKLETGEPDPFLEITFDAPSHPETSSHPERSEGSSPTPQVIRKRIYDFELSYLNSKKYGPLFVRDQDKILLIPQARKTFLVFDLNGMLLEKKPVTEEIASRYELKPIHELLFAKDDFALIPKGTFEMGSPPNEEGRSDNETLHTVKLPKDFYLQRTEVTQLQWYLVMGEAPSYFKERKYCEEEWDEELGICPNHPVEEVSWDDVQRFIQRFNEMQTRYAYRLPTEAEWEYAARVSGVGDVERRKFLTADGFLDIRESGSAKAKYSFGDSEDRLEEYGWYYKNAKDQTHSVLDPWIKPIGGLYNMHGNVWEMVSDWYGEYPTGTVIDPGGPLLGSNRVYRGGSWSNNPLHLRSAGRNYNSPGARYYDLGFRVLRTKK